MMQRMMDCVENRVKARETAVSVTCGKKSAYTTHHSERCDCGCRSAMPYIGVTPQHSGKTVSSNATAFILYRAAL